MSTTRSLNQLFLSRVWRWCLVEMWLICPLQWWLQYDHQLLPSGRSSPQSKKSLAAVSRGKISLDHRASIIDYQLCHTDRWIQYPADNIVKWEILIGSRNTNIYWSERFSFIPNQCASNHIDILGRVHHNTWRSEVIPSSTGLGAVWRNQWSSFIDFRIRRLYYHIGCLNHNTVGWESWFREPSLNSYWG
jgi:hypothetical protein